MGRLPAEEAALTHFDLSLLLVEEDGQLGGWMVYRIDLFEPTTIERMASSLENLLATIAASPDQHISELVTVFDNDLDSAPGQPATLSFNSSRTGEAP
jgi:non-ribosomal peptide synthetase component F